MDDEEIKNSSKVSQSQEKSKEKNEFTDEEIEIEEVENEEEEDIKSSSKGEKTNSINSSSKEPTPQDKYLLELNTDGLPEIPNNKILSCNIGSLLNISLYNGLPISSNIALISDALQIFKSHDFIDKLIEDSLNKEKNLENNYFEEKLKAFMKSPSMINTKIFFQIKCERAGNITFVFMYKDESDNNKIKFSKPFYILVNPLIELNKEIKLEINQIRMQTVIPKNIGKIEDDFDTYFSEASLLGYNFIHFKTLQSLSSSDNLYSIKDHNELNNIFF